MYNETFYSDRRHSCCYCLQSLISAQTLERHVNDCFAINDKQMIKLAKKEAHKLLNLWYSFVEDDVTLRDLCHILLVNIGVFANGCC